MFPFQVNHRTGVISTRRPLDRETDGCYFRFDILTGNLTGEQFVVSDRAAIEVHVVDRNDNSPTILFPVCDDVDFRDCELDVTATSTGDLITRVIAADADDVTEQLLSLIHI